MFTYFLTYLPAYQLEIFLVLSLNFISSLEQILMHVTCGRPRLGSAIRSVLPVFSMTPFLRIMDPIRRHVDTVAASDVIASSCAD